MSEIKWGLIGGIIFLIVFNVLLLLAGSVILTSIFEPVTIAIETIAAVIVTGIIFVFVRRERQQGVSK